jgi:hypothetical protein
VRGSEYRCGHRAALIQNANPTVLAVDFLRGTHAGATNVSVRAWTSRPSGPQGPGRVRRRKRHDPSSPRWGCRAHNNSAIQRRRPIMKMRGYRAIFVALVTTTSWLVAEPHDQTSSRSSSGLSGPEGNPWVRQRALRHRKPVRAGFGGRFRRFLNEDKVNSCVYIFRQQTPVTGFTFGNEELPRTCPLPVLVAQEIVSTMIPVLRRFAERIVASVPACLPTGHTGPIATATTSLQSVSRL